MRRLYYQQNVMIQCKPIRPIRLASGDYTNNFDVEVSSGDQGNYEKLLK